MEEMDRTIDTLALAALYQDKVTAMGQPMLPIALAKQRNLRAALAKNLPEGTLADIAEDLHLLETGNMPTRF